jgi:hypothetical protein
MILPTHATSLVPHIAPLTTAQTANEPRPEAFFFVVLPGLPDCRSDPNTEEVDDENDEHGV